MPSLEDGFQKFHKENPHVFNELKKLALTLKARGFSRYGMKALFEVVRYHRAIKTNDPNFKLNNNYTAFYSRLLMNKVPELKGFFATRERKSA